MTKPAGERRFQGQEATRLARLSATSMAVAGFEEWSRAWGATDATIAHRAELLHRLERDWPDLAGVTSQMVREFLATPAFSGWTRLTYYNTLSSIFEWLQATDQRPDNPMGAVRRPRTPRGIPKPLSEAEVDRVLLAATGQVRAWLVLALYAGLRSHEIAKIRGEDVSETELFVNGKGGKEAYLPTHPSIWELAAGYPGSGPWFPSWRGEHVQADTITLQVRRLFRQVQVPHGSIHRCRHTYGTRLIRSGANLRVVQTLMRHESLATTALYLAVDEGERRSAIRLLS